MAKNQSVGVREFAKQVGCSHVLILNLIKRGIMPQNKDKTIPLKAGLAAYENRKELGKEKKKEESKKGKKSEKKEKTSKKVSRVTLPEDPTEEEAEDDSEDETPSLSGKSKDVYDLTTQFNKARLAEKTYQAKLKEIEFKLKKGELIPKTEVEADAAAVASEIRERLTSIPVRISALCERQSARKIEEVMSDAIQDALVSLSKSKFVKGNNEEAETK